jgi:transposase
MTLSVTVQAEIVRLHHAERWRIGTIATQLGVHHSSVRRVLEQAGIAVPAISARHSALDPFVPFITDTLERYPTLTAARLYEMVAERGYGGSPGHFRHRVARYRPRRQGEAYLRLRTLPGEQAQVDWGLCRARHRPH